MSGCGVCDERISRLGTDYGVGGEPASGPFRDSVRPGPGRGRFELRDPLPCPDPGSRRRTTRPVGTATLRSPGGIHTEGTGSARGAVSRNPAAAAADDGPRPCQARTELDQTVPSLAHAPAG